MLQSLAGGLFGELWGTSPPLVVVLHGWRRTHSDFVGVVGPASDAGPLPSVAPDLPGFGATPEPRSVWGSAEYAQAVAEMIDGSGGAEGPAVVVGHSLGGRVAATLAANRPDLVSALVLTGAPLMPRTGAQRRPPRSYRMVKALHRFGLVGEARLERTRQRHGSDDYRNARGTMRDVLVRMTNESYDDVLARVRCHVELIWGSDDTEVPVALAHAIGERLSGANLTVCEGAGHLLPTERPVELRKTVERAMSFGAAREKGAGSSGDTTSGTTR